MLIVLLAARILAELAGRLKAPSVIGELMVGVVIVIALTTLLPPFVMKWYFGRYGQAIA